MVDGQSVKEISLETIRWWYLRLYVIGEGHQRYLFSIRGTMLRLSIYRGRKFIYF